MPVIVMLLSMITFVIVMWALLAMSITLVVGLGPWWVAAAVAALLLYRHRNYLKELFV